MEIVMHAIVVMNIFVVVYSVHHCFNNDRIDPSTALIYAIIIVILPVVGTIIYFKQDYERLKKAKIRSRKNLRRKNRYTKI